ncbi:MAG: apolipoprotein N-acyltransferase [Chitinophagaceae bacterium]|nr:MAG: apolipoprotein N-acyltransferase [Chitinophagaceae bacterium]
MWLSWPPIAIFPLACVAFSVIFILEHVISKRQNSNTNAALFFYVYIFFIAWNAPTTWWIYYSTLPGAIAANMLNALLMSIPVLLFHVVKKRTTEATGYFSLIAFWLSFEHIHHQWEFTWPWLSLGNVFSYYPSLIQWYEYTGMFGGTLWILLLNLLFFLWIKHTFIEKSSETKKSRYKLPHPLISYLLIFVIPIGISFAIYYNYEEKGYPVDIVVVQPNVDPYGEKFIEETVDEQLERMLSLADSLSDENTDYIVFPETALPRGVWLDQIENDKHVNRIYDFLEQKYPHISLVTGISAYIRYTDVTEPPTPTARRYRSGDCCYDAFNSAVQLDTSRVLQLYHKSKLVPGVERMPYPGIFKFLAPLTIDLGGISGSLGRQDYRGVFFTEDNKGIAPVICYESVYGEHVAEYINNGANAIFIVTNDGWWDDTPGYKQHLYFSSLRAIEGRKSIARSANTGISAFINQRGDILQPTEFWEPAVIRGVIYFNDYKTFYIRYGDYISRLAILLSIMSLLFAFVKGKTKRF